LFANKNKCMLNSFECFGIARKWMTESRIFCYIASQFNEISYTETSIVQD